MDIDDDSRLQLNQQSARVIASVDDAHPLDLEGYISNYSGRTAIDRLIHILQTCPTIAREVFDLAVQHIHQSRDPSLYQHLLSVYDQFSTIPDSLVKIPNLMELAQLNTKWADETLSRNQADKIKLEVELKTYTNNMIKESIRMAHRDLGEFYRSVGEYSSALKHLTKSREFCTTSQHVLDMCLSVLELLLEQRNYSHLPTYVFKAEAALDATSNNNNGGNGASSNSLLPNVMAATKKRSSERQGLQSKLDLATALSHLAGSNYERAAYHFLRLGPTRELGDWAGKVVTASDIAIYGTLCALSSMSRSSLNSQLVGNATFNNYIEQEPYIRELIEAYMSSDFKVVLEILEKYSTRHLIDIHLAPHVTELTNQIRNWAVVFYFQPFASIRLHRMSKAFGWTLEEVEANIVQLIQVGSVQGRVDSQNKILYAKKTDFRSELFARAIKAGMEIQAENRKLLLRMKLQQAELMIKPPKGSHPTMPLEMMGRD